MGTSTRSEGSKRLDRTLSSEDFAQKDNVSRIVKNHILKSSFAESDHNGKLIGGKHIDDVTQYWSGKIGTFLDELRSASTVHTGKLKPTEDIGGHPREWKLKDESERYRVMYREGPEGTPVHTLCLDGLVDGDFTSGLCVAWESPLYKEWWPQFTVPAFKIMESKWLRRIRVGQDLSLLRFKVPWPLAQREVVMSVFEIEHLQEDFLIGLVESVPESVEINENIHGFSAADLPPLSSHVRMELSGGFVMQRTSTDQFFFRTIVSLDMKLDFVPPWLINFISRQLAGQGLKLYQKAVLAASNGNGSGKAFQKPLKNDDMYNRVRLGLEAKKEATGDTQTMEKLQPIKENGKAKSLQGSIRRMGSSEYNRVVPYPVTADEIKEISVESGALITDESVQPLVVSPPEHHKNRAAEEVKPPRVATEEIQPDVAGSSKGAQAKSSLNEDGVREYDDPEVVWAMNVLDKMISLTRSCAAEQATASESVESEVESRKVESITLDSKETVSGGALVKDSRKPPAPLAKDENCNIVEVKSASASNAIDKSDNNESSRSRGLQPSGGDAESSGHSSFWSTSEIEVISSQDDTDTDIGASSNSIVGLPIVHRPKVEMKRRWRKWQWTCFSPSVPRKSVELGRGNFYARDSGRVSGGQLRALLEASGSRTNKNRGYRTDGDERYGSKQILKTQGRSSGRSVTLGDLLLDGQR